MYFFQIPPVAARSIFDSMLDQFVFDKPAPTLTPEERGCNFFKDLKLFRLEQQMRSSDPQQTANIHKLRVKDPLQAPLTPEILADYPSITSNDINTDSRWETLPIITQLNDVRHEINRIRILRFARLTGNCIIMWENPLCGKQAAGLSHEEKRMLYATHQALSGKFVPGLPSVFQDNISPIKGMSNGARCKQHSLILDPRENKARLLDRIAKAKPAETIVLDFPPLAVVVELLDVDLDRLSPGDSLVPGKAVVPVFARSRSRFEPIKSWETISREDPIEGVRYRSIGVEPQFAITFEKAQARTLDGVILDLNQWPGIHLSFEKVYVALTRVKTRNDIRLMPLHPGQNFQHLYSLKPDARMLVWLAGFGPDGMWDPQRCIEKLKTLPCNVLKRKSKPRPRRQPAQPSNKSASPSKQNKQHGQSDSGSTMRSTKKRGA